MYNELLTHVKCLLTNRLHGKAAEQLEYVAAKQLQNTSSTACVTLSITRVLVYNERTNFLTRVQALANKSLTW